MIEIKNLNKQYEDKVIFNKVDLDLPPHGLYLIIGPSGVGKSTLLNILSGFDSDYTGSVSILGKDIKDFNEQEKSQYRHQNIGFIFQNYLLLNGYTVLENILLSHKNTDENIRKTQDLLQNLHIQEKENERVENLSGGQKQRVAIARSLFNDPNIVLADEPTGALDRKNANEIMEIFKAISKEKLVIVITHDKKLLSYADASIEIDNQDLQLSKKLPVTSQNIEKSNKKPSSNIKERSIKNFKLNFRKYLTIAIISAIAISSVLFSLSFKNVITHEISLFQEKNIALHTAFIKLDDDKPKIEEIKSDIRLQNVYYQYKLENLNLKYNDTTVNIETLYPVSKANEIISYGKMPTHDTSEIAISPSLAKKFSENIKDLIGKRIKLDYNEKTYNVTVSGIYNAVYDDFILSSQLEQELYSTNEFTSPYSISYDVKNFEDIPIVNQDMMKSNIMVQDASKEVENLLSTFMSLNKIFRVISIMIVVISILIIGVIITKHQNTRYKEMGLYATLGFTKAQNQKLVLLENTYLSLLSMIFTTITTSVLMLITHVLKFPVNITALDIFVSGISSMLVVLVISFILVSRLINTEPAVALRK